jgi:hypothetical protein
VVRIDECLNRCATHFFEQFYTCKKSIMSEPAENEETKPQTSWRFYVFAILNLIVFWSSWPLVSAEFPQFSAGLQFCLAATLPMIFMIISAPIWQGFRRAGKNVPEQKPQRKWTATALVALFCTFWFANVLSWYANAYIETNALSQPDHAAGQYTVPSHLKGVVRYMTPAQAIIDNVAHWIFFGSIVPFLGFVVVDRLRKKKHRG